MHSHVQGVVYTRPQHFQTPQGKIMLQNVAEQCVKGMREAPFSRAFDTLLRDILEHDTAQGCMEVDANICRQAGTLLQQGPGQCCLKPRTRSDLSATTC